LQRVAVLAGAGGTGKTELVKGFARWWRDTGGVDDPRLVFWHSFEPGVASFGLDGVITGIGLALFGADFARLDPAERLVAVRQLLEQHRVLLVWDNFETVREMPDPTGATPPLDEAGCAALLGFLEFLPGAELLACQRQVRVGSGLVERSGRVLGLLLVAGRRALQRRQVVRPAVQRPAGVAHRAGGLVQVVGQLADVLVERVRGVTLPETAGLTCLGQCLVRLFQVPGDYTVEALPAFGFGVNAGKPSPGQ